ncbi:MAG: response regulator [Candidatus Obscuribacterales bacterium]|nr:response regulator [Candidatus Obscuribacterales bacterium]
MNKIALSLLLIEDNLGDARLFIEALRDIEGQDFTVEQVSKLKEGLELLGSGHYDIVLVDLFLPDSRGLDTFLQIRDRVPDLPVLVLTGFNDEKLAVEAVKNGAQDYLLKAELSPNLLKRALRYAVERKQAEKLAQYAIRAEHEITQEILEHAPVGIWMIDQDKIIRQVNLVACQQISLGPADLVGHKLLSVLPSLPSDRLKRALSQGLPFNLENFPWRSPEASVVDKERGYWDVVVWPIYGGDSAPKGVVAITTDVTERVRASRQREDFVAMLAHDLKTPLIGADRALEFISADTIGILTSAQTQVIGMLQQSTQSLLQMIQNLLEVYRYEASVPVLDLQSVGVSEVISRCIRELAPLAQSKQIEVVSEIADDLPRISGDEIAMRRLFMNLLDNSIKFTPQNGSIRFRAYGKKGYVHIEVSDTGAGVSIIEQPKLFDRYWQGERTRKPYSSGTGLGLYLCRQIAEAHSGSISYSDAENGGSCFIVRLPQEGKHKVGNKDLSLPREV